METKDKILVVDDANGWRKFHVQMLENLYNGKYDIDVAASGREGYDFVYNNLQKPYKLIITDLQMEMDFEPQSAGEWFVEQVKLLDAYRNVPIILISATYNIRMIAETLHVNCLPKHTAANDLNTYKLALEELI